MVSDIDMYDEEQDEPCQVRFVHKSVLERQTCESYRPTNCHGAGRVLGGSSTKLQSASGAAWRNWLKRVVSEYLR
eukprot:3338752-Pleurochrysis_carterae.AAC.3